MIFHNIWLPAYTTTRLSDLTWGNRETASLDETKTALQRARNGRRVAFALIACNASVAVAVILLMQNVGATFPCFVIAYMMILSFTYVIAFADLLLRFITCSHLDHMEDEPVILEDYNDSSTDTSSDGYVTMEEVAQVEELEQKANNETETIGYVNMEEQLASASESNAAGKEDESNGI
jgi:hypothetical protein